MKILGIFLTASAMLFGVLATSANAAIVIDTSIGTSAPPASLGGYTMSPFAQTFAPPSASVTTVTDGGNTLTFDRAVTTAGVGNGWGTWSNGYTGQVFHTASTRDTSLGITLPTGTKAFYFYAQPNTFGNFDITLSYTGATGSPATQNVSGSAGAKFFGIYGTAGEDLTGTLSITTTDQFGFAVGQFGINVNATVPEPSSLAIFGLGASLMGLAAWKKRRV